MGRERNFKSACLFYSNKLTFKGKYFTLYRLCITALCYTLWSHSLAKSRHIFSLASWTFPPDALRNLAGPASKTDLVVILPLLNLLSFLYVWCWSLLPWDRSCRVVFCSFFSDCSYAWFLGHINSVLETLSKSAFPLHLLCFRVRWGPHHLLVGQLQ